MKNLRLIGPISQLLTMDHLPLKGALKDEQMEILENVGILIEGENICEIGDFENLKTKAKNLDAELIELEGLHIAVPGFVDCHTHICFGGSRARDFAMRNSGKSYLEIAEAGGGIWDTVTQTRKLSLDELAEKTIQNANRHLAQGVTTIEVKSGYGLSIDEELKMLRAIKKANNSTPADLISTCLAAHMKPRDFTGSNSEYLADISEKLFPVLQREKLCNRIDAFVEKSAFSPDEIKPYFQKAKDFGFDITVHADQFTTGGSEIAILFEAK
jgi:imidazolonepropionase